MSVAAIMLVKDEVDVVGPTLEHLLDEVDEVIVADNGSTDGTRELARELGARVVTDDDVGYWQARKTTLLADDARSLGHQWVVPCDADEYWYAPDGRRLREYLGGLAPDVAFVTADLYNHLPTGLDRLAADPCPRCRGGTDGLCHDADCPLCHGHAAEPNPLLRIGWRQREHGALGKVACRLLPGLEIRAGNHAAWAPGGGMAVGGLVIRHYTWRSREQYVLKIENGARAYAATDLPETTGEHWRMFGLPPDGGDELDEWRARVGDHFDRWFFVADPARDRDDLIYDPAPFVGRTS